MAELAGLVSFLKFDHIFHTVDDIICRCVHEIINGAAFGAWHACIRRHGISDCSCTFILMSAERAFVH